MLKGYQNYPCGLLGEHLGHSFSPQIHARLADYPYSLIELPNEEAVGAYLKEGRFSALNVTIPYKKTVVPYMKELSPAAKRIGSVNTIVKAPDGSLIGDNTDYYGFSYLVKKSEIEIKGKKVLILGSGGASLTARTVCADMGARAVIVISRGGENNYSNLDLHEDADVIVNCTPVGMFPNNGVAPLDLKRFPHLCGVLDMVYNPAKTQLLLDADKLGIPNQNGLAMLVAQAKRASELFLGGVSIPDTVIDEITHAIALETGNIILIGMPGCGKSTIAKKLSEMTGRPVVDTDAMIVERIGCSIPEFFATHGEDTFRDVESACAKDAGKLSGHIIATGGGIIKRAENYDPLHQNGLFCFIERPLEELPRDGRPLSQNASLVKMYEERFPRYQLFADVTIQNNSTPEEAAANILKEIASCAF